MNTATHHLISNPHRGQFIPVAEIASAIKGRPSKTCRHQNCYDLRMAPTVFRQGAFRFFFFSRKEPREHVHVVHTDGEA